LFDALKSCESDRRQEDCVMRIVSSYVAKLAEEKKASEDYSDKLRESIRRRA
jgi:hypothetical protein